MRTSLPEEVLTFGASVRRSLERLGGTELALRAEVDRSLRAAVGSTLQELGVEELDVRLDEEQLLAAAELCRVSGALALPWPIVEDLLAVAGARLALVDPANPRVDHGDLPGAWVGCDLDGQSFELTMHPAARAKLGPFLVPAARGGDLPPVGAADVSRHLVLGSWRLFGGLQTCFERVVEHVGVRVQFGRPLSAFQTVRFAIADASVAMRGFEELVKFTTWRLGSAPAQQALADAYALRLQGAETAVRVLRTCHQLFGAVGFCDEHGVSVLDRHLQPLIRLPVSSESLAARLVPLVGRGDFEGLFA